MIKNIIDLLNLSDYYGVSKKIDIAKVVENVNSIIATI
jgi:hypothetical protein